MSELCFSARVAIITGAGGGLGRSHALELARRGVSVLVNDLGGAVDGSGSSDSAAQHVVDEIVASGGNAVANHESVATPEGAQRIIDAAVTAFGHVDILVNNAGILRDKAFHQMDAAMIDAVLDVHLRGSMFMANAAFKLMRAQGYGRIINTTSASGMFGNFGQANYGAAKAGLFGLTRVLSIEGAFKNIKVNAIAPLAATRMTENLLGDLDTKVAPQSVSAVVAYLASDDCSVSGNVYSVSGGRVARIFVAETYGVVIPGLTGEDVAGQINIIDKIDPAGFLQPDTLADETEIITKAITDRP